VATLRKKSKIIKKLIKGLREKGPGDKGNGHTKQASNNM